MQVLNYICYCSWLLRSIKQTPATDEDDDSADDVTSAPGGTIAGYNTADILAAVSDSAEEGIALLSNWFGLTPAAVNETSLESATDKVESDDLALDQP